MTAPSAGIPVDEGLGPADEMDGDAVPGGELGLASGDDVAQLTATSTSAALARAHADVSLVLLVLKGGRRIIATTLAGRGPYGGLVGNEKPTKV